MKLLQTIDGAYTLLAWLVFLIALFVVFGPF